MIYTVTINPTLDYVIDVDEVTLGRTNRPTDEFYRPGGKGVIESMVFRNLGHYNTALGFIAGFTGQQIKRALVDCKVNMDFIELPRGNSRMCVIVNSTQETRFNGRGPQIEEFHINLFKSKLQRLQDGDVLTFAGSIPPTMHETFYADMMRALPKRDIKVVVDATGALLKRALPERPFLVKPNNHELGDIFDVEIETKEDAKKYGLELQKLGAQNVIVSMGAQGAVFIDIDGNTYEADSCKGEVVNTIGAGDSMIAGFVSGYLEREDYEYAFHKGMCAGAATAQTKGFATKEAVEALMKENFGY